MWNAGFFDSQAQRRCRRFRVGADALIILAIVLISGLLRFWQEKGATDAVNRLLALVSVQATALRDGAAVGIPVEAVVLGDVLLLKASVSVAADGR